MARHAASSLPLTATPHGHLRLAAALPPQPRLRRQGGRPGTPTYPNRAEHADSVRDYAIRSIRTHHLRSPVLGVEPELILVIELAHRLDPVPLERAELRVLDLTGEFAMVAFASDPELSEFLRRLDAYSTGPRHDEGSAPYEALFDAIIRPRPLEVGDVLSPALRGHLDSLEHFDDAIKIDVQCWCPEDEAEARRRQQDFLHAVSTAGGRLIAGDFRPWVGLSLLRVEVAAGAVPDLARTDRARSIDLLPRPILTQPQVFATTPADLPVVIPPLPGSPLIAVIDSGVASAHPLISPAVDGVAAIGIGGGGDGHGHGTFVASLALGGSLEPVLNSRTPLRPAGRLLSIRVLDNDLLFPDELLWETILLDALRRAADAGARVVNLSLGDPRRPYRPPRPTVLAAAIDDLSRRLGLVVVISAGNYPLAQHSRAEQVINDYPALMLQDGSGGLLDPAPAALALTVGALCTDYDQGAVPHRENIDRQPLGRAGHPSPATRTGPGPMCMIKPELCAPGGGFSYDYGTNHLVERDPVVHVLGADGSRPDRLLATGAGTSFAAPLVSHAALRVLGAYPALTANGVRALLLASAEPTQPVIESDSEAVAREQQARLTGYGRVSARRAEASDDHRAVLLAEEVMRVNDVHVFTVPVPSSFTKRGGWRRITVALAYDPPVRPTRLDYLASRMDFWAFHGVTVEQVRNSYAAPAEDTNTVPATLTDLHLKLQPSTTLRSPGANQWASRTFPQLFKGVTANW
jgi:Subtilase family